MAGSAARRFSTGKRRRDLCRQAAVFIATAILDLLTLLVLCVLVPVVAAILGLAYVAPCLERLLHPWREYADGISTTWINCLEGGVIHAVTTWQQRTPTEEFFENFDKLYISSGRPEFARLRQRVVRRTWFWPYWTEPELRWEPSYHYRSYTEVVSQADLEEKLSAMQSQLLDFDRPLWQLHHFENFVDEHGWPRSVTIMRMHHGMVDGFTGLRLMIQGFDPNVPPTSDAPSRRPRRGSCLKTLLRLPHFFLAMLRKQLLALSDPPSAYKSRAYLQPEGARVACWNTLRGTRVEDLKRLGKELGGATVNDILMTALTGALRKTAEEMESPLVQDVQTAVWVSRVPMKQVWAPLSDVPFRWGNSSLGVISLNLPAGPSHSRLKASETLEALRARTSDPSLMVEAASSVHLLAMLAGWLPPCLARALYVPLCNKVTLSCSNVPGPQFNLKWCGHTVRNMVFFVPPCGTVSLFVTIATWNGEVCVGISGDAALFDSERKLKALQSLPRVFFEDEIRRLGKDAEDASRELVRAQGPDGLEQPGRALQRALLP